MKLILFLKGLYTNINDKTSIQIHRLYDIIDYVT